MIRNINSDENIPSWIVYNSLGERVIDEVEFCRCLINDLRISRRYYREGQYGGYDIVNDKPQKTEYWLGNAREQLTPCEINSYILARVLPYVVQNLADTVKNLRKALDIILDGLVCRELDDFVDWAEKEDGVRENGEEIEK